VLSDGAKDFEAKVLELGHATIIHGNQLLRFLESL
jgi:hypothetical protein